MVRIIYHTSKHGYRILDRRTHEEILCLETSLRNADASVICIVDLKNGIVSNKSSDFIAHMDRIDAILFDKDYIQL